MRPAIATLAFLALASFDSAAAGALPAWERIGPDGGSICALAAAPASPAVLYAGGETFGGVFRSEDSGQSWTFSGAGLGLRPACSIAVDAGDPARVWTVAAGQLFLTRNGGRSWQPLASPEPAGYLLSVIAHPKIPGRLLLATTRRVWRSKNGGAA